MRAFATPAEALEQLLEQQEFPFTVILQHGTMTVEYFAPQEKDTQQPHLQDELYVVISGRATLMRDGERIHCQPGDILFVPARMEHWFETFTDNFATWVIFYGPPGGEKNRR